MGIFETSLRIIVVSKEKETVGSLFLFLFLFLFSLKETSEKMKRKELRWFKARSARTEAFFVFNISGAEASIAFWKSTTSKLEKQIKKRSVLVDRDQNGADALKIRLVCEGNSSLL